ncbi:hypothetical protein OESDEN_14690 [Oesophagostomum dentatum]|uniref:Uncharacterized protein n=1 Tax=Oesophagostomum dentatum TaxID=61180 RepID=A0A0B1SKY5_OESDE|nr:hypothetical protein OESDEN_14690 [Oesophagostomum dentatum]
MRCAVILCTSIEPGLYRNHATLHRLPDRERATVLNI